MSSAEPRFRRDDMIVARVYVRFLNSEGVTLLIYKVIMSSFQDLNSCCAWFATTISPLRGFSNNIQINFFQNLTALPFEVFPATFRLSFQNLTALFFRIILKIFVQREGLLFTVGHNACFLIVAYTFLKEIGFALQRNQIHPREWVGGVVHFFIAQRNQ